MAQDELPQALTFDDVLLMPAESAVLPAEVNISTRLTSKIDLKIPIISAAMDTVTESAMAIAMAQAGGIGVIHRNMSVEEQSEEVARVKRFESGLILNPVTVSPDMTIGELRDMKSKYGFSGFPVVNGGGRLAGIITNRDIRFVEDETSKVSELMTNEIVTVGQDYDPKVAQSLLQQHRIEKLVVVDDDGNCAGMITAGNIATGDAAKMLIEAGADAVKVGIGPGSICTTRIVSGVGVPQLTAVQSVVEVCRPRGIPVIADGGIKYSGDISKAIAAGADCVMIGSLLAGTDESPGETILYQGRSYKVYRGMGSVGAMSKGAHDRYFQSEQGDTRKYVPEGIEGRVPARGPVENVIHQLVGGLRSSMGYTGNGSISEMKGGCEFVRITNAGLSESHVHDVEITREAPNYRR